MEQSQQIRTKKLQQFALDAVVQNVAKIPSLGSIPSRICFKIHQQIQSRYPWNMSLLRVLDAIELSVDFAYINTSFAIDSKSLAKLFYFYYKYSKTTIRQIIFCNDLLSSIPRIPNVIDKFACFPVEMVEFRMVEFDNVEISSFFVSLVHNHAGFLFFRCSRFEVLHVQDVVFNYVKIALIDCTWHNVDVFWMAASIEIQSKSHIPNFMLPMNSRCKHLWIENADLTNFIPNDSLEVLHLPNWHDCPEHLLFLL